jgi:2-C-methyl-D-erythritol 4-phosphate cytidylyltransferase
MKKYAIIVAGGKGIRMNTGLPKQFIPINGKPLLMSTLEAFSSYDNKLLTSTMRHPKTSQVH